MTISAAAIVLGLCVFGTVLLIVSAAAMLFIKDRVALRWTHVVTRLLSVALLGITLLFMAPRVIALYLLFGGESPTALPTVGVPVFTLSHWTVTYFPQLLLFGLVAVALEMMFFESCVRRDERVEGARLCSFLVTCTTGLTLLICEVGIAVSLLKLSNDLY